MEENEEILKFAEYLADEASKLTLSMFRMDIDVENKSDSSFDPVTIADKESELLIRKLIKDRFPNHGIIGEEFDNEEVNDNPYWVIDPIDGTRAFILGIPVWGTLIAYNDGEIPVIGIVDQPFLNDRYIGYENKSFKISDSKKQRISTSQLKDLKNCTISSTDPTLFSDKDIISFNKLSSLCYSKRFGLDCMGYCLLASGKIDLVAEADLEIYDVQALIPIVRGAGGVITTWDGKDPNNGGNILASASQELHSIALDILNNNSRN